MGWFTTSLSQMRGAKSREARTASNTRRFFYFPVFLFSGGFLKVPPGAPRCPRVPPVGGWEGAQGSCRAPGGPWGAGGRELWG